MLHRTVTCPNCCHQSLHPGDKYVGRRVRCPRCKQVNQISTADVLVPIDEKPSSTAPEPDAIKLPHFPPREEIVHDLVRVLWVVPTCVIGFLICGYAVIWHPQHTTAIASLIIVLLLLRRKS